MPVGTGVGVRNKNMVSAKAEVALLIDILDQAFDRPAWHGTNLRGSLRGLKLHELVWRPSPGRHNIWETSLHTAYWKYIVYRRLVGAKKGSFPRKPSDWPILPTSVSLGNWKADLQLLVEQHCLLRDAVAGIRPGRLKSNLSGSKVTCERLIYGASSHDLYHAGQIQLLKRLQRAKK